MNKYEKALNVISQNLQLVIHDDDGLNPEYSKEQVYALTIAVEALEKQIPKKVILGYDEQDSICCPNCKGELMSMDWYDHWKCNYCEVCGQALDWSDTK